MKISYGITVHNEADELNELLKFLIHKTHENDEIVICDDYSDEETQFVLQSWLQQYGHAKTIKIYQRKLDGDFSAQKNSVIENCDGDYIFHIDADEIPHENLVNILPKMVETNDVDLVWVPRVNTVEGITQEHIDKWGWRVSSKGWINYPDYQARVYRNTDAIHWTRKVHEYIVGTKEYSHLPPHEELSLYHHKSIDKQEQQNRLYSDILENSR